MKKLLMMMSVFVFGLCASAQITTNSSCDSNLNGMVTIEDVTNTANKVLGAPAKEEEVVTAAQVNATLKQINANYDEILRRLVYLQKAGTYDYPFIDSYEYVDLGLPSGTLWATCNIGATSPYEIGDYFAWGETAPKAVYSYATYSLCNGGKTSMTKYCTNSDYGTVDNKTELEACDDAAIANLGKGWQMPSVDQFNELFNSSYTTRVWITENGVSGYKITSKISGYTDKFIFLPATGYISTSTLAASSYGFYWTHTLDKTQNFCAKYRYFEASGVGISSSYRHMGRPIRAVCAASRGEVITTISVTAITLSQYSASLFKGETLTLTKTVSPSTATDPSVTWTSSNPSVATVSTSGVVTAVSEGTAVINATANGGNGVTASCTVTVKKALPSDPNDYVDLGLPSGTLWANRNVGTNNPYETGDFYGWGSTKKWGYGSWSNYFDSNDSSGGTFKKYTSDGPTELEAEDDIATVLWGEEWQLPSKAQWDELCNGNNTRTEWTTLNGSPGIKVYSKKTGYTDKYIFLPAGGVSISSSNLFISEKGYYWSRTLDTSSISSISDAYNLQFSDSQFYVTTQARCAGMRVRAVCVSTLK